MKEKRYSKHSFLVHGKYWSKSWDFEHHVVPPITSSSTFRLESAERGAAGFCGYGQPSGRGGVFIYDRLDEPTRAMLEERIAYAEGGDAAVCFATGMAAIAAATGIGLRAGDEILAHRTLYGCTYSLFTTWYSRFGIRVRYADLARSVPVGPRTRVVYFETPVNPTMELLDIRAIADAAGRALVIVDNTFATPFCQRPLERGAAMSVHSLTKNICGFGTDMGGAVVAAKRFEPDLLLYRKDFGGSLSPKNAWPILVYGLPSLELRIRKEEQNALEIARFLRAHRKIAGVSYPGLEGFPQIELARRQMTDFDGHFAPGNMLAFTMKSDAASRRLVDHVAKHAYTITLAVSLGQIRTLIEKPGSMTHSAIPKEARHGMAPGLVRLSVGIEDPGDIIRDLSEALDAC
jgi:cystathionine beta-lyase/cystathionine gamma-synthase